MSFATRVHAVMGVEIHSVVHFWWIPLGSVMLTQSVEQEIKSQNCGFEPHVRPGVRLDGALSNSTILRIFSQLKRLLPLNDHQLIVAWRDPLCLILGEHLQMRLCFNVLLWNVIDVSHLKLPWPQMIDKWLVLPTCQVCSRQVEEVEIWAAGLNWFPTLLTVWIKNKTKSFFFPLSWIASALFSKIVGCRVNGTW